MAPIRTRLAPSPTGWLHIGTARTAFFNYLYAKKHGGTFVLRIEDTDIERSDKAFETDIFESLAWLGIKADESPVEGGPHAPYRQSERLASYRPYLERLLETGNAFYCPHSEAELEAERTKLMEQKRPPAHICPSRDKGRGVGSGIIRFKTPRGRTLTFTDLIRGEISFESDLLGDFSLAKDLSIPLYNFAVVIDDHEMKISHVIRGEDHISNTPKQMLIQEALGLPTPAYAHLPLILGPDRSKLSKRHGATAIREFREQGYLPETLVNFMALLGWNPGDNREVFSMAELIEHFDLGNVQKSGAIFNIEKLDWLNGEYIRKLSPAELLEHAAPFLPQTYTAYPKPYTLAVLALEQPRLKKLSEVGEKVEYFFEVPEYDPALLRWKQTSDDDTSSSLQQSLDILEAIPEGGFSARALEAMFLAAIGAGDKGVLLWPLRVSLTGTRASPGPFDILAILGKEEGRTRIRRAMEKLRDLGGG